MYLTHIWLISDSCQASTFAKYGEFLLITFYLPYFTCMTIHPRKMFLIDGLGAVASTFMIGLVIAHNVNFFGLPAKAAYFLASLPVLFLIYSLGHYIKFPKVWRPNLKGIAIANLLYCFISIGVIFYHFNSMTIFGLVYFIGEIILLIFLVAYELRLTKHSRD